MRAKRHSIITTIFARSGFHRNTHLELCNWGDNVNCDPYECYRKSDTIIYPHVLPGFTLRGISFRFSMFYRETSSSEIYNVWNNRLPNRPVDAHTWIPEKGIGSIAIESDATETNDYDTESILPVMEEIISRSPSKIRILPTIIMGSCICFDDNDSMTAIRKASVARELVTVYRKLITHIQAIIYTVYVQNGGTPADFDYVKEIIELTPLNSHGGSTADGMHSTTADAWRLLCSYHSIEQHLKGTDLQSVDLQGYLDLLTNPDDDTARSFIDKFAHDARVRREVAFRRLLEYYIFNSLPT